MDFLKLFLLMCTFVALTGLTSAEPLAYVADGNTINVIDIATNYIKATIDTGSNAYGIATNPAGTKVYVVHGGYTNTLSVVDMIEKTVLPVDLGTGAYDIAVSPDGKKAYIGCGPFNPNKILVFDTATNSVVDEISPGANAYEIAFTPSGDRAYVSCLEHVVVIDTASDSVVKSISVLPGYGSQGIALNPAGTRAYVTLRRAYIEGELGRLCVIDTSTNEFINIDGATVGVNPQGVAVSPDGSKIYVANSGSNRVSVINAGTNSVEKTVYVSSQPYDIVVTADGKTLLVTAHKDGCVDVVDASTGVVAAGIMMSSPKGIVIVSSPPEPVAIEINDFIANKTYIPEEMAVSFTPSVTGRAVEWKWVVKKTDTNSDNYIRKFDVSENPDDYMVVATFHKAGVYDITFTATDAEGNTDTMTKAAYVTVYKEKEKKDPKLLEEEASISDSYYDSELSKM